MEQQPFSTESLFAFILEMFQPMMKRSGTKLTFQVKHANELRLEQNRVQNVPLLLQNYAFEGQSLRMDLPAVLIGDQRRLK